MRAVFFQALFLRGHKIYDCDNPNVDCTGGGSTSSSDQEPSSSPTAEPCSSEPSEPESSEPSEPKREPDSEASEPSSSGTGGSTQECANSLLRSTQRAQNTTALVINEYCVAVVL